MVRRLVTLKKRRKTFTDVSAAGRKHGKQRQHCTDEDMISKHPQRAAASTLAAPTEGKQISCKTNRRLKLQFLYDKRESITKQKHRAAWSACGPSNSDL